MCYQVTCPTCGKATWAGCGQHVEQALAGVPRAQRCPGHSAGAPPVTVEGKPSTAPRRAVSGWFGRRSR